MYDLYYRSVNIFAKKEDILITRKTYCVMFKIVLNNLVTSYYPQSIKHMNIFTVHIKCTNCVLIFIFPEIIQNAKVLPVSR